MSAIFIAIKEIQTRVKHRYVSGIASGSRTDGDGEIMLPQTITNFQKSAETGTVLLYCAGHNANKQSDYLTDIGKLTSSEILPNGDWFVEFRLWDKDDINIASINREISNQLWAQMSGLPPYDKPIDKGFSIEAPGKKYQDQNTGKILWDIPEIKKIVLVDAPAYRQFVMTAEKQLSQSPFFEISKTAKSIFQGGWELTNLLEEKIESILENDNEDIFEKIKLVGTDFGTALGELYARLKSIKQLDQKDNSSLPLFNISEILTKACKPKKPEETSKKSTAKKSQKNVDGIKADLSRGFEMPSNFCQQLKTAVVGVISDKTRD